MLQDVVLFEAIILDLFPDVQLPSPIRQDLTASVQAACRGLGLQPADSFVSKVLQLHDTLEVRFGVMLVGLAGARR